jgi:SAM-dependent methyltransferase
MNKKYDYRKEEDADLRMLYKSMIDYGKDAVQALWQGYQKGQAPGVAFRFVDNGDNFDASARVRGKGYDIEVSAPMVYLLRELFDRIFSYDFVIPALQDESGRLRMSSTLSEFCSAFVIYHEVAHIACGHTDLLNKRRKGRMLHELVEEVSQGEIRMLRAFECDADVVAAGLLAKMIYNFSRDVSLNPGFREIYDVLRPGGYIAEKLTALALLSLLTMFLYSTQVRDNLDKKSYHPEAMLRMYYIREVLIAGMKMNGRFSIKRIEYYAEAYYRQIIPALISVVPIPKYGIIKTKDMYAQRNELQLAAAGEREVTRPFCWIPLDDWVYY